MGTLLVDNYDSFTYNLFDLLARVNGEEPVVVRNDEPVPGRLDAFDSIVISPGPGRPDRIGDFGHWAEVIATSRVPILGVCLGHQGICQVHGARVGLASEPWHGRVSQVFHDGTGLFAGLPSPFAATRYHSLAVYELPPSLEATAWTADGVLMAVRHRTLPQWGVQFHPESIATEHGLELLRNFRDLTAGPEKARTSPTKASARPASEPTKGAEPAERSAAPTHRVLVRAVPTWASEEAVFEALYRDSPAAFWLDSTRRFAYMGEAAQVVTADVWAGTVTTGRDGAGAAAAAGGAVAAVPFFEWLRDDLAGRRVAVPPELPFDFALGWVGYLGYELKAECGGDRAHRSAYPDATLLFAERALAFDHAEQITYLMALVRVGDEDAARAWFDATIGAAAGRPSGRDCGGSPHGTGHGGFEKGFEGKEKPFTARHSRAGYLKLIDACHQEIAAGESYEICLTNMLSAAVAVDPWTAYTRLRRDNPAPYGAFLRHGDLAVLSTSPELFLRIGADGTVESKPIKGTRPRSGSGPDEDRAVREELRASEKDRAENLMIVDLVRNDLGRCAQVGTVSVPRLFDVETFATVHQLVSTVRARVAAGTSPVDVVRAAFPGGSMTGAPKVRTMRIIDELEGGPRGVYSGAIGYFSLSGAVELGMTIRTVVATPGELTYGAGGAVIALSDPAEEYAETLTKAAPFERLAVNLSPKGLRPGEKHGFA